MDEQNTLHIPKYRDQNLSCWCLRFCLLTADLTPEWSGKSMFHPLSHIYAKTFCSAETVANNALNCRCVVIFDRLWANAVPTLNTAFSLTNDHAKWWIHCFLISSTLLLSSIYDRPKRVCGIFSCFLGNFWIWVIWESNILCVCTTACTVSIAPLNRCFGRSRVRITLMKPLLWLNRIFPSRKQCFINTRYPDFSIALKICNNSFT